MIVLHAIWDYLIDSTLHIWAETSSPTASAVKRKSKQADAAQSRSHPYALNWDQLLEAMGTLTGNLLAKNLLPAVLTHVLPSTDIGPLPSPELLLDERSDEQTTGLAPWEVSSLHFDARLALEFLLALPEQPPHGIVYGSSLRFWIEAAKFTLELLTRQCFLPTVRVGRAHDGLSGYQAAWEVFLSPEDSERMRRLAKAMPPVCRAVIPAEHSRKPVEMLVHFLNRSADAFIRQGMAGTSVVPLPRRSRRANLPLQEQWLQALVSADNPHLIGVERDLKQFTAEIATWLSQLRPSEMKAPFRTCFRLEPPPEEDDPTAEGEKIETEHGEQTWWLGFYLQATDDPSLLVETEQVWRERTDTLRLLKHKFENPQERLLADLGKASRLFPALEQSLHSARPVGLSLDTAEAYAFLRQAAPLLEQSGFGVLLPAWWKKPALRLGLKLKARPQQPMEKVESSGLLGQDGIVAYDWQIALGDDELSPAEFEHLSSLKVPLVKVRGQWVELKPEELAAALAFLQKKDTRKKKLGFDEALRLGLGGEDAALGLPVLGIEGEGWVKDLLEQLTNTAKLEPVPQPSTLQGTLRPYQLQGLAWLAFLRRFGLGACLADDMGLGKTIAYISLMLHERSLLPAGVKPAPSLLICPMSVVGNWQKELARFAPSLSAIVHHGPDRLSAKAFEREAQKHDLVLTTYALAQRDAEDLSKIRWDCVVLDEAQNIKNQYAKQTQAIMQLDARSRIALTGTPVENRLSELWSIMQFLNPGYLGPSETFRKTYATPIERYRDEAKTAALKRMIQPFVLRRVKTDKSIIQDLPEKMEMKVYCNLTREQATLYEAVVKDMLEKIEQLEGIERRGLILVTMMKIKQICNHPAHFLKDESNLYGRSGKLARLEEMLEEAVQEGDKALVFTQFAEMGSLLRSHLQQVLGREVLFLHGGVPKMQRDMMIQRFQSERNGPPVFILSLKAGGFGLNLTAANHVFHFDRWWNPAVENQATDRAFRIGQTKNVQVHKFISIGTLEEKIDQLIEQKKELAQAVVGSGEGWVTELSTDQLRELFTLNRNAIGD